LYNRVFLRKNWKTILLKVKTDGLEAELRNILEQICQSAGWKYGEIWIPDGDHLQCHPAYYKADEELAEFRRGSEDFTFTPGSGLAGRVWLLRESEWIENVSIEPAIYYRSHLAKNVGLKAAIGVPILAEQEVVAVMILYSDKAEPPDDKAIAKACESIKHLIG
jgi:GAF domain-containing protein